MAEVVDGVDGLRRAARERLRSGAHAIKIMASGGVISPSDPLRVPQYSPEEIRVVAEEAARRGSYVAAHAYSAEAIGVAVANGVRSIEHGNLLDAPTAALMAERDAFLVPTLVTYDAMERRGAELGLAPVAQAKNREVLDAGRTAIRLAREAGVRIGFGTDLMGSLDDEQLHGLRLQAEVEGPLALLRAATSVNAELLGRDDLGRIGPGAVADLLVLDGDPLRDPSVLWGDPNRRAVFQGGIRVAEQGARLVLLPRTAGWRAHPAASTGVAARVRRVSGELLTIASLNTRGIPLTGSQLAERYAVIGAGFDAGDADVVCCQEVLTYWHLRLLVRRMRSFRQVSYRPGPFGPTWRPGHVLPAAGIRHGVPAFRPAAPGSRRSPGVPFPGQAERRPGDPAGPPGAVRDQHPSGGQP